MEEIKRLVASVESLKTSLKQKELEYNALNISYQKEQNEIKSLEAQIEDRNEQIKSLEAELERYKTSKPKTENESQPQTEVFTVEGVSFKMIHVEGGTFVMGANDNDQLASNDEKPAHEVTLSDYWMGETQVTQALWQAVMGENPSYYKGGPDLPVECVSWLDCREFIRKLNKLTGKRFRLPTEAQWEFAARGGNLGKGHQHLYAGSNDIFDVAWYDENSKEKTHPVGERDPNELGLYDMSGNVWEWCNDWYEETYYSNSPSIDPIGPSNGSNRVNRGGGWYSIAGRCRVSGRNNNTPTSTYYSLGLRLAL